MNKESDATLRILREVTDSEWCRNWLLIVSTFSVKKEVKDSAERLVAVGGAGGLSSDLKVENSLRVSLVVLILSL